MKKVPVERSVLGGFAFAMVVILVLSDIAKLSSGRHDEAVRNVMNAYERLAAIREIMSNMHHAEEAQRDYLMEGEEGYLKSRDEALLAVDMAIGKTGRLITVASAQDSLREIQGLIAKRQKIFHDIQTVSDISRLAAARSQFGRSEAVLSQLENAVDEMISAEANQLQERIDDEKRQHNIETVSYALLNLLLPMFFIFLFFRIRRDICLRSNAEMALAETHERRDLAQDLHDDLAQILAVARIKLMQMLKGDKAAGGMPLLHEINELVMRANQSVRLLLAQINRMPAEGMGLMPMFSWLTQELRLTHDVDIQVRGDGSPMLADQQVDIVVFRTVRDLLLNAARSGGKIKLMMEHIGNNIFITLSDGSDFSSIAMRLHDGDPGLDIIGERLRRIGGKMSVASHANGETVVTLRVPARISNPQRIAA